MLPKRGSVNNRFNASIKVHKRHRKQNQRNNLWQKLLDEDIDRFKWFNFYFKKKLNLEAISKTKKHLKEQDFY